MFISWYKCMLWTSIILNTIFSSVFILTTILERGRLGNWFLCPHKGSSSSVLFIHSGKARHICSACGYIITKREFLFYTNKKFSERGASVCKNKDLDNLYFLFFSFLFQFVLWFSSHYFLSPEMRKVYHFIHSQHYHRDERPILF